MGKWGRAKCWLLLYNQDIMLLKITPNIHKQLLHCLHLNLPTLQTRSTELLFVAAPQCSYWFVCYYDSQLQSRVISTHLSGVLHFTAAQLKSIRMHASATAHTCGRARTEHLACIWEENNWASENLSANQPAPSEAWTGCEEKRHVKVLSIPHFWQYV